MEELGTKDTEIAQLVDSSNAVFKVFAKEDASLQSTLHLLPSALHKTGTALEKTAIASNQVGPALHTLLPFAKSVAPANEATKKLALTTTPVIKNEIRPFAREILPTVNELGPSTQGLAESFPKLATSFSVINEFFNELAYNPGKGKAGFNFFLAWANHNLNSVVANADAHGTLGPKPHLLQLQHDADHPRRGRSQRTGQTPDRACCGCRPKANAKALV